jgi:hypothetical protein
MTICEWKGVMKYAKIGVLYAIMGEGGGKGENKCQYVR